MPDFSLPDMQAAATPQVLARGRELAVGVEGLDWDEYSVWGCLPGEGIGAGELMIHHEGRPLAGECPCPEAGGAGLCAHMAAVGWAFLGDDGELAERLAGLSHAELVAVVAELVERSGWVREVVRSRLPR